MPNSPLLIMRLEGPLQSWGLRSKWDIRDSGPEPTKSGIIGLIGCSLGYSRNDARLVSELESNIKIGIRIENPGLPLVDFHTITCRLPTAEGGYKGTVDDPSTIISNRTYLQDASFIIILEGPTDLLIKIKESLNDPVWPIYLGRKSCPPTRPVFEDLTTKYETREDALRNYPWCAAYSNNTSNMLRYVNEDSHGKLERLDRMQISPVRMYANRKVSEEYIELPKIKGVSCTSQD